jgi:chromate transporter
VVNYPVSPDEPGAPSRPASRSADDPRKGTIGEVFAAFLKLGLTSFGGPVAHLGYFRIEFVERRGWLDEAAYADLVALCQFLPGPASSQVGMAIGLLRAGYLGVLAAWAGFTLPSAVALVLFAWGTTAFGSALGSGWLHGLKVAAVAVVAAAVLAMARSLAPDRERATFAVVAAVIVLAASSAWGQIGAIALGGVAGLALLRTGAMARAAPLHIAASRKVGAAALALFAALLIGLPLVAANSSDHGLKLFDAFYRAGSLVFGGGHVVLPLLSAAVVPPGWVSNDTFLAGYGAAQAVPGPLFTFAAYLGAVMAPAPNGVAGAALCLVAIFLPSFFLVTGTLPFWEVLRSKPAAQAVLKGVNAAVVGVLLAALYQPVWTSAILNARDFAVAIVAFLLLFLWRLPPWLVVVLCAIAGAAVL